jgi:hypothetical protein
VRWGAFVVVLVVVAAALGWPYGRQSPALTTTQRHIQAAAAATSPTTPAPPTLTLKRPVVLRWTAQPRATNYKVYRDSSPTGNQPPTLIANTTALTFTAYIPCNGTIPSRLTVRAVVGGVIGPPSNERWWTC